MPTPDDLFGPAETPPESAAGRPLADRLRPADLSEVVGQDHLLGPDGTLTRMLQRGSLASLILWGPPGVGKTTIARLLAARSGLHFTQLSAVFSGVADLKRTFEEATRRHRTGQGAAAGRAGALTGHARPGSGMRSPRRGVRPGRHDLARRPMGELASARRLRRRKHKDVVRGPRHDPSGQADPEVPDKTARNKTKCELKSDSSRAMIPS